ncbi:dispanin subfamily A member 2b-like [Mantella aurantiaca]
MEGDTKNSYQHSSAMINMQAEPAITQPPYKDYLIWSICNMICCCFPIGIAALIFSVKTRDAIYTKDDIAAGRNSRLTFKLNVASSVIGVVLFVAIFILYFVVGIYAYRGSQ